MAKFQLTEPIGEFELMIPAAQAERFFEAVAWRLPTRPPSPPTLATTFRRGELMALQKLGIALPSVLHGEQKYRFVKNILPDQAYKGQTFVSSHYEKSGPSGTMNFFVFQTNLRDSRGELHVECLTTIIARS